MPCSGLLDLQKYTAEMNIYTWVNTFFWVNNYLPASANTIA